MLLSTNPPGRAAVLWDEAQRGDLSNNPADPTETTLVAGPNILAVTSGGPGPDRDYLRFTVPSGYQLTHVFLNNFTTLFDGKAFIGIQSGSAITVKPSNASPAPLLGYSHFGPDVEPLVPPFDYLPAMGTGVGATGFTGALGSGTYSVWLQQTSTSSPSTYELNFAVEPNPTQQDVPLPTWAVAVQGGLLSVGIWWRLRRCPQTSAPGQIEARHSQPGASSDANA